MGTKIRPLFLMFLLCLSLLAASKGKWMKFVATAYSVEGETASGAQTREGRTVAADVDVLPLGTKIEVKGAGPYSGVYVVHDSGRKISGREIDIFLDSPSEAKKFGKQPVSVRVLEKPKQGEEVKKK